MMSPAEAWESLYALLFLYPLFLVGMVYFWYKDIYLQRHHFRREDEAIKADQLKNRELALKYQLINAVEFALRDFK